MGYEMDRTAPSPRNTDTDEPTPTPVGKTTRVDADTQTAAAVPTQTTTDSTEPPDRAAKVKQLLATLEREFARRPLTAKQAALSLSLELPGMFTTEWLVAIYKRIDAA